MKPELRHLLNGYATGTLTEEERKRLFAAAFEDQAVFEALAEEQSLKDLLDDPEARGYLLAELERPPVVTVSPVAGASGTRAGGRLWLPFAAVMLGLVVTGGVWWRTRPAEPAVVAVQARPPLATGLPKTRGPETRVPPPVRNEVKSVSEPVRSSPALADAERRPQAAAAPALDAVKKEARDPAPAQVAERAPEKIPERVLESAADRQSEKAVASASAPVPVPARMAASPVAHELWRLENGQFVRTPPGGRFASGDIIFVRLPWEEAPPRVTFGPGRPLTLERDGDWYRTEAVTLASGEQDFVVAPAGTALRSRLAAPPAVEGKAKPVPAEVRRIRISVP